MEGAKAAAAIAESVGEAMMVTGGPAAVVSADFDGDGTLDIAVFDLAGGRITVWMGNPTAGFRRAADARTASGVDGGPGERLTSRERQVAVLIAGGYTDAEIASRLGIGRRTAETHTANVRAKLGLKSRRELLHARRS